MLRPNFWRLPLISFEEMNEGRELGRSSPQVKSSSTGSTAPDMTGKALATLDWHYKGMKTLVMENRLVRIVFLLDKGGDIIELKYKPLDIDLTWHAPQGHVNPAEYIPSIAIADGSFNDLLRRGLAGRGPCNWQRSSGTSWGQIRDAWRIAGDAMEL